MKAHLVATTAVIVVLALIALFVATPQGFFLLVGAVIFIAFLVGVYVGALQLYREWEEYR